MTEGFEERNQCALECGLQTRWRLKQKAMFADCMSPAPPCPGNHVRTMHGGGCGKWRSPTGRGGGLESYSRFACIGAPGGTGGMCAQLPLLLADPAATVPGYMTLQSLEVCPYV